MPAVILLIIVIVVGVVIAVRTGTSTEGGRTVGLWSLVGGLVAVAGVAMTGQATFGWVSGFDPPQWLRVVTIGMLPAGVVAATTLGALALRRHSGRPSGIAGLGFAALAAVAFLAMIASVDY